MAVLKCKMCGGDLNVSGGEKIAECAFCGTTQTVPDGNDEKKTNLFNRANRLRTNNEFDKAAGIYESIIAEFPEEAEGYWGLVLCNYGIEYVDDAKTGKKIPTCHRILTSSVMEDGDFMQACENADVVARGIYREEAKAIDKLQKQIISIAESEEPYDVFICYKETDDITKLRTEDSRLAQDIYTELIKEGYKVFFSRVTLRKKAGTEYEPYIYAALRSAKIMLAIGTKYDYYDAAWVKNEWNRYILMMSEDNSKHLIPCYKNLDAYDIPKEFKNLQALDMGEITFFKNLIDNVERFIPKTKKTETKIEQAVSNVAGSTTGSLLKRAFIFLEDSDWNRANEYLEKVLDIDPECAEAYLGKLMAELKVRKRDDLALSNSFFENNTSYKNFIRFANNNQKAEMEEILQALNSHVPAIPAKETFAEMMGLPPHHSGSIKDEWLTSLAKMSDAELVFRYDSDDYIDDYKFCCYNELYKRFKEHINQNTFRNKSEATEWIDNITQKMERYRELDVCQYCGGEFIGAFTKICKLCGKQKDY